MPPTIEAAPNRRTGRAQVAHIPVIRPVSLGTDGATAITATAVRHAEQRPLDQFHSADDRPRPGGRPPHIARWLARNSASPMRPCVLIIYYLTVGEKGPVKPERRAHRAMIRAT